MARAWALQLQPGDYRVWGYGTKSCGSWTEAQKKDTRARSLFHTWVAGYLTAYSGWVETDHLGPVNNADLEGSWAWLDNYCRDNPLDGVAHAAEELIFAIKAK